MCIGTHRVHPLTQTYTRPLSQPRALHTHTCGCQQVTDRCYWMTSAHGPRGIGPAELALERGTSERGVEQATGRASEVPSERRASESSAPSRRRAERTRGQASEGGCESGASERAERVPEGRARKVVRVLPRAISVIGLANGPFGWRGWPA